MAAMQNNLALAAQSFYKKRMPPRPKNQGVKAPSAPSVPYSPGASSAGNTATPGSANTSAGYNYLDDPTALLDQASIVQRYGTESAKIAEASTQDRIALNRAYSMLGADSSGAFKSGVFGNNAVQNEGTYYSDIRKAQEGANKAGLFYSGISGRDIGDIKTSYANRTGDLNQNFQNAENDRAIGRRDLEGNLGPGGIAERRVIQEGTDRFNAAASQKALIDAITGGGSSGGGGGATAPAMNPLPGLGSLPLSTGFAGLDPKQTYRTASNGRLQVKNSNGTWRYVN